MTVRLHLWALTGTIVWCLLLAAVSWLLVRWLPGHRAVALMVFLLSNIAQCVPYMRVAFAEWVRDPHNPIWFLNVMWFATFALIATPASIIWGGRVRAHR